MGRLCAPVRWSLSWSYSVFIKRTPSLHVFDATSSYKPARRTIPKIILYEKQKSGTARLLMLEDKYIQIILGHDAVAGAQHCKPFICINIHAHNVDTLHNPLRHAIACLRVAQAIPETHCFLCLAYPQIGMENELIPKADVQAQVELLQSHLKQLRTIVPTNKIYLIAEANMSCTLLACCTRLCGTQTTCLSTFSFLFLSRGAGKPFCAPGKYTRHHTDRPPLLSHPYLSVCPLPSIGHTRRKKRQRWNHHHAGIQRKRRASITGGHRQQHGHKGKGRHLQHRKNSVAR